MGLAGSCSLGLSFVFFRLVGISLHFLFFRAKMRQAVECAGVLAIQTSLFAAHEFEMRGLAGARANGEHGAVQVGIVCRVIFHDALVADFEVDGGGMECPQAGLMPSGDNHVFDEGMLGGGSGLKFGFVVAKERVKAGRGFAIDENELREIRFSCAVAGGDALTRGCDRAVRELRIGAVGCEAFF
jgi:hypothetical protein